MGTSTSRHLPSILKQGETEEEIERKVKQLEIKELNRSRFNHMWRFYMKLMAKERSNVQDKKRSQQPHILEVSLAGVRLDVSLFLRILHFCSVEEICSKIYLVHKEWYRVTHDHANSETLWKVVAELQEIQQRKHYDFSGSLFSFETFSKYLAEDPEEFENPNPLYVKTGKLWRRYCILQRLYNRICEESFIHCFPGAEPLFSGIPDEYQGRAIFFGPRNISVGKTTLIQSLLNGRPLEKAQLQKIPPTTGLEQTVLCALIDQQHLLKLHNWDTVMSTFSTTVRSVRGCTLEIFLFDLSNEESFDTLTEGFTFDLINQPVGDTRRLLIGLKSELKKDNRLTNKALEFGRQYGMFYVEGSSYSGHNLQLIARLCGMLSYFVLIGRHVKPSSS